ncbi:MAG: VWA domain-containing protein, partial [Clostridia bacterium]|nr:VWA domain-containing protein [Clostridia bacterium]
MNRKTIFRRILALLMALTVLAVAIPFTGLLTLAGEAEGYTVEADASTAQTFESMLGTDKDGNRYAGRVWVDKSVYTDKQVSLDGFTVTHDEDFLVVYSALGSSGTVTTATETGSLLDVVLVLDASASMAADNRLEQVVSAADSLLSGLTGGKNRIAVVTYNAKAATVAPLEAYEALTLSVEKTGDGVGVVARDGNTVVGRTGYTGTGTGTQLGVQRGLELLQQNAVTGRTPVMILLTGGEANVAARDTWTDAEDSHSLSDYHGGTTEGVVLSTLLNSAYWKSAVEKAYGRKALVYTVSTQVPESQQANTLTIADPESWFTANSAAAAGKEAYAWYRTWADSSNAYSAQDAGRVSWTFPQLTTDSLGFPNNEYGVTKQNVMDNIHYVNRHFAADNGDELQAAMDEILTTVSTPSFIPTVDTEVQGDAASSVPITYVDFIGDYMHVKNIRAVTLFGKQYAVMEAGAETTYSYGEVNTETTVVSYAVGFGAGEIEHPTLGTVFSVSNAVWMELTTEVTGTVDPATGDFEATGVPRQTLRVFVRSEALPVLLETVSVATDGTIRYEETLADPLRVYYTVEVNPAILDEKGQVDLSRVDEAYTKANTVGGKVQFYASRFGEMNPSASGTVTQGDTHVSFQPSRENRYYYHQNSNAVFYDVTDENGKPLVAEENEYGVTYAPHMDGYRYEYMDAAHLFTWQDGRLVDKAIPDDHPLYTYIEFYYPTAGGKGEMVYLLSFATWGEMKNSLTAVELTEGTTPSGQKLFKYIWDESTVVTVEELREYIEANYQPGFDLTRIRARVAAQSLRVSRLHHMIEEKAENVTGTAVNAYVPAYNENAVHVGGIVVWLGNNGVLSTEAEVGITIANTLSAVAPEDTGEAFAFTVTSDTATDTGETVILRHVDAAGVESRSTAVFSGGKLTVALRAGESVSLVGLTKGAHYIVQAAENAYYNPVVNGTDGDTVVLLAVAGEFMDADFIHTPKKFGNLTINAVVEHPYGIGYVLPEDLTFVVDTHLTLNGKPLANKTFVAEHTGDSTVTSVTTDENGVVRMVLAHNDQVELFGLEAGTVANGTQYYFDGTAYYTYGQVAGKWYPGFGAPIYWDDDGTHDDDQVVVVAGQTVTAGVINAYTPAAFSAHIRLEGVKSMVGNWPADTRFAFQLQQYNPLTGSWERVEEIAVTQSAPAIRFDETFTYTAVGTYSYQAVEATGDTAG